MDIWKRKKENQRSDLREPGWTKRRGKGPLKPKRWMKRKDDSKPESVKAMDQKTQWITKKEKPQAWITKKEKPQAWITKKKKTDDAGEVRPPNKWIQKKLYREGGHVNTRRENRLEELGRVDAEKAYTRKGKRNLKAEKRRIVREVSSRGAAKRGHGSEIK